ncbi:MAG: DinB family protein [Chloroflexi bacterium]|nr:DinB family protein [Chloroflexota bacterium]
MASFRDPIKSGLNEYYGKLKQTVKGLTPEELLWQPGPESNHILWTVWHMARVSDRWANSTVLGGEELWTRDDWAKRLGMPVDRYGRGETPEQVRDFPSVEIGLVLQYFDEAHASMLAMVDALEQADLDRDVFAAYRNESLNIGWILGHILAEESQHLGQVAYIRGIQRGFNG